MISSGTFTPTVDGYARLTIFQKEVSVDTFMFVEGSTLPATYSPYSNLCPISGHTGVDVYVKAEYDPQAEPTIPITFPDEAGTVYGCTLDVVSGVLTVDRAIVDLGTLSWNRNAASGGKYRMQTADLASVIKAPADNNTPANIICSRYKTIKANDVYGRVLGIGVYMAGNVAVYDENYSDGTAETIAAFNAAMSGVQLVYELATPITYQLTPQEVDTLVGQNNVWHDANGDTTVEYRSN